MSKASERRKMIESIAGYSLLGVRAFAGLVGVEMEEAERIVRDNEIPSVVVGKLTRIDPIDAFLFLIARERGVPFESLLALPGEQRVRLAREARDRMGKSWPIPKKEPKGHVYAIVAPAAGKVKIGFSMNVEKRLRSLQSVSPVPLRLVESWPARQKFEKRLHRELADLRSHGEWFAEEAIDRARALMEEWDT